MSITPDLVDQQAEPSAKVKVNANEYSENLYNPRK